jgi:HSP20 family protein
MKLIRWQPLQELDTLHREMNRLFDSFYPTRFNERLDLDFMPAAELHETDDALHLKLEIPGMEAKDLEVQVTSESVFISGERKQETRTEEGGMTRSEFRYGQFQRTIPLPMRVVNTDVNAEYKNGVLTLTLPKAEEEKNKVVKVNLG